MELISLEDFNKLEIKIAEIKEVEKIPNTEKLLKLKIDLGDEIRTIISGIGLEYQKEELIGKQIVVLTNLKPKTFRGIESRGMLLAAVNQKEKISLLIPDKKMSPGDKIS